MPARLKPVELKLLDGSASHVDMNIGPRKGGPIGPCPSKESEAVRAVWDECALDWELLLTVQDRKAFLSFCRTQVRYDMACQKLEAEGEVDYNSHGRAVTSLWASRVVTLTDQIVKYYVHFGATPTARNRVPGRRITPTEARRGGLDLLT